MIMGEWEAKFREFFKNDTEKRYARDIVKKLFGQFTTGELAEKMKKMYEDSYEKNFFSIFDTFAENIENKKEYSASIFPTLISPDKGANFFLKNEKKPDREELFYFFYLLATGIFCDKYIINLDTNSDAWYSFLQKLKREESFIFSKNKEGVKYNQGIRTDILSSYLSPSIKYIPRPITSNMFVFMMINFYVIWWLQENYDLKIKDEFALPEYLEDIGIDDTATLYIFEYASKDRNAREKNKIYIYPKINKFINQWYAKYLSSHNEDDLFLPKFLSSFLINDDQFKDKLLKYLDKFLYYLLRGHVNGKLLDQLVNLKIDLYLKNKYAYINRVSDFLTKI